jgi:flavin-dependent dehydrogenase
MYDAMIVGARVAGAPTGMLLARRGYRVLLVDRSTFPSDIMSTHFIHPYGIAALQRWGLLDAVTGSGCPPIHAVMRGFGDQVAPGPVMVAGDVDVAYCPRHKVLDDILVQAAVTAGAELREGFSVHDLLIEDGAVVGIRGQAHGGSTVEERARVVIGADGIHSLVARAVQAPTYNEHPASSCGYYSYFSGVPLTTGTEVLYFGGPSVLAFATNDGLTCVAVLRPIDEFPAFRADIDGMFAETLALAPDLSARVQAGKREERWIGTAGTANFYRQPFGPGWALVGDAGYHKDPITGFGISDAFRDAELLADALDAGFSGRQPLDEALTGYQQRRDAASAPLYELTWRLAAYQGPPLGMARIFAEVFGRPPAEAAAG